MKGEDVAWHTFLGFLICLVFTLVSVAVFFLWKWLGWWTLIGIVGVFMALCLFFIVGWTAEKIGSS